MIFYNIANDIRTSGLVLSCVENDKMYTKKYTDVVYEMKQRN